MKTYEVKSIGEIKQEGECFVIQLEEAYKEGLKALQGFSYIQVLWWCSELDKEEYRNIITTEKPYKKSPEVMGIFATRSPIRPNPIALTAVQVLHIDEAKGTIMIPYIDAFDHTPVLDIKPYTPSIDRVIEPSVPAWCSHWPMCVEESGDFNWENEFNF